MFPEHNLSDVWKFVDRKEETSRLSEALAREKAALVVLYGRRRPGKFTLIKRVLTDEDIYFPADRSVGTYKRELLPFADGCMIVSVLFLKNKHCDEAENVLYPADILRMPR